MQIPIHEIKATFARSSGAGGQNVNKTSTKVILHWPIGNTRVFSWEEQQRIRSKLSNRINGSDELVVISEEERSQLQNRARATARMRSLVAQALHVPKKRMPSGPTCASKLKRLEDKTHRASLKIKRRKGFFMIQ